MKQKFDAIIFDVDGTLWDSTDVAASAYNEIFVREKLPYHVDADDLKKLFGKPMDEIFSIICPGCEAAYLKTLADDCMAVENAELEKGCCDYYPGVHETIEALSKEMPVFIVSNCQKGYIEIMLQRRHMEPFIKDFLCFGDTGTSKGQTILTLMKKHGLTHPVYVGDTAGDEEACHEAGIPAIYCAYGFGIMEKPYAKINSIAELKEMFLN